MDGPGVGLCRGNQGSGTPVPGGAMFQIDLFSGATTYDSESIPITLQ